MGIRTPSAIAVNSPPTMSQLRPVDLVRAGWLRILVGSVDMSQVYVAKPLESIDPNVGQYWPMTNPRSQLWMLAAGTLASLAVVALWGTLAAFNPTTTYHLSPIVVAVAAPTVARMYHRTRLSTRFAVASVLIGVAAATGAALAIHALGWSIGPTIDPSISLFAEVAVAIAIGGAIGAATALPGPRRGRRPR